jgi:hypothetical protein
MTHDPPPGAPQGPPPAHGVLPPPYAGPYAGPYLGPSAGPSAGPSWRPPVHHPGAVPLRPLTLGDLFVGAVLTIRRNPMATVGLAAVVTLVFMLLPIVVTVVLGLTGAFPRTTPFDASTPSTGFGFNAASLASGVPSALATIVVTGAVMRVVEAAVVGRRLSAAAAWERCRASLLRLLGLCLLALVVGVVVLGLAVGAGVAVGLAVGSTPVTVLLGILGGLLGVVVAVYLFVRYLLLAAPNLVIEGNGVRASLRRGSELSRGQLWRLLGTYLLAVLVVGLVSQVLAVPFALLGVASLFLLPGSWGMAGMLLVSYVTSIITGALASPFVGCLTALQYYDQRFRKEAHHVELSNPVPQRPQY